MNTQPVPPAQRALTLSASALLRLVIPSAGFTLLTNAYRIVDQFYVGGISVAAQAAVGASTFVLILFYALFECVSAGAGPLLARATGAEDFVSRRRIFAISLLGSFAIGLVIMVVGSAAAPKIAELLGLEGAAAVACTAYLRALAWTILPLALTPTVDQAFLSLGNARTPLLLHALSVGLNIVLTPALIYGLHWGVVGAALATNISRAVATALGLRQLFALVGWVPADLREMRELLRILRIGFPMGLGTAFFAGIYWALLYTSVSPLGPEINAALGIGFSGLEGITWPLFHGLSLAVASFVGRCLGAGRPDEARRALRMALPIACVLGGVATTLFAACGGWLTSWFTNDPGVHRAATEYAIILSVSQMFLAIEALSEGVLAGAGATQAVFWFSVPCNLARIPLAYGLAISAGYGAAGVWWAINLTTMLKACLKGGSAWRGRWTNLRV